MENLEAENRGEQFNEQDFLNRVENTIGNAQEQLEELQRLEKLARDSYIESTQQSQGFTNMEKLHDLLEPIRKKRQAILESINETPS